MNAQEIATQRTLDISTRNLAELQEISNTLFDDLVTKVVNNKIPEEVFVHHFLPFFSGQKAITKNDTVMIDWISVSGSPLAEVDVFDAGGEVLFTVPSLMNTNIVNPSRRDRDVGFAEIQAQYDLQNNNLPVVATKQLTDALDKKADVLMDTNLNLSNSEQRWKDIFTRYNIQNDIADTSSSTTKEEHEELIYD